MNHTSIWYSGRHGKTAMALDIFLKSNHQEALWLCATEQASQRLYEQLVGNHRFTTTLYHSQTKKEPIRCMVDEYESPKESHEYFVGDHIDHWGVILTKRKAQDP